MNSKKSIITLVVVIVVLVAGWLIWRGGGLQGFRMMPNGGQTPLSQTGGNGGGEMTDGKIETTGTVGKMTDDIYVEMMAQVAYLSQKSPATYVANVESLYKKYGITQENMTAYAKEFEANPQRAAEIIQKYQQRLIELQKTGN